MSYNIEAHMAIRMAKLKLDQAKPAKEIDMDTKTTSDQTSAYFNVSTLGGSSAYFNSTRASRGSVVKKEGK